MLGYADDAIIAVAVLRSVARAVGLEPLQRHWPGSPDGLAALSRLAGLGRIPEDQAAGGDTSAPGSSGGGGDCSGPT